MRVIDGGRTPKYEAIAAALTQRIAEGTYPLHSRLPPVRALALEFDASIETISSALARLAELGLVEGRPRSGTVVIAEQPRQQERPVREPRSLAQRVADLERRMDEHEQGHHGPGADPAASP